MIIEAVMMPGIGFLFAGLSAISIGGAIQYELIDTQNYAQQFGVFLALSFAWAMLLWWPLKLFHKGNFQDGFSNIIGETATVYGAPLTKGSAGKVRWSGTTMKAQITPNSEIESIDAGEGVVITEIKGTTLFVRKK
jgi:membrane protein implicated in regulation of membrane protease activity